MTTISHTTRQMMATPDWSWRHGNSTSASDIERRAAEILRNDYSRAASWLHQVSELAGMPLPLGNGTNGPWHRLACATEAGRLGIVDIAAGRCVEYDAFCPSYVKRFACGTKGKGTSPHHAGGGGGVPEHWRQVAVILSGLPTVVRTPPSVTPIGITWGYTTCYGTIGVEPTRDDWREEWKQYFGSCPINETNEEQREEVPLGSGVDPSVWEEFRKEWNRNENYHKLVSTTGSHFRGYVYVHVTGTRLVRRTAIADLLTNWRSFVVRRSQEMVAKLWESCGLDLPDTTGGSRYRTFDWHAPNGYRLNTVAAALTVDPMTGLTEAERAEIKATAERMLAADPATVAVAVRARAATYRGDAAPAASNLYTCGYAAGVKQHLYQRVRTINGCNEWTHVAEFPGIREWHIAVRREVEATEEKCVSTT